MNRLLNQWFLAIALCAAPALAGADDAAPPALVPIQQVQFDFSNAPVGIERRSLGEGVRVRGWEVSDRVYFGQAKVGEKWGVGVVYERGDTVYGINHRGIQIVKRF